MKKKYDLKSPMAPPWFMFPHIPRYSIGWRMGYGEDYIYKFSDWFDALTLEDQNQYRQMFPTPKGWMGWYDEEPSEEDFYDDEGCLHWNEGGKMKYSLDDLIKDYQEGKKIKYLFSGVINRLTTELLQNLA